jgi:hypothetical protein
MGKEKNDDGDAMGERATGGEREARIVYCTSLNTCTGGLIKFHIELLHVFN